MYWDRMTMDELAQCQQAQGLKLVRLDGVWWVEVRPFFFRPLFPFAEIDPRSQKYPKKSVVGGVLHAVPDGVPANSSMNFFVYDDLKNYSINTLSSKQRAATRTSLKHFSAKTLTDADEFIDTAYDVYLSFHKRTNYSYKDERVKRQEFIQWAKTLYKFPKIKKLGVYHNGRLSAIECSYYLNDVIVGDTLFADDAGLKLKVTDFVYHSMREAAAQTDARYFFIGLPTGVKSLDQSKLLRGCKVLTMPACYRINPVTLQVAKVFMRSSYNKLMEIISPPPREAPAEPAGTIARRAEPQSEEAPAGGSTAASALSEAPEPVAVETSLQAQEAATTDNRSAPSGS